MKLEFFSLLCLLVVLPAHSSESSKDDGNLLMNVENDRCTSIVVGAKAGSEGPMNTHTAG